MTARVDPEAKRLMVCAGVAIVIHAASAAAIFLGFGSVGAATAQPAAQMVVELAALPSAPPVPPSLAPPEPEQRKAQPKPTLIRLDVPPPPELTVPVAAEVVVPARADSDPKVERRDTAALTTTHAAAPDAPRDDSARAPAIGAPSASTSAAQQTWEAKVLAALERKKRYPSEAQRQGQQDTIFVRIRIDPSGRLLASNIRRSMGYDLLNSEVDSLVRRASPYPSPPADVMVGKSDVTLLVPIEFFLNKTRGRR